MSAKTKSSRGFHSSGGSPALSVSTHGFYSKQAVAAVTQPTNAPKRGRPLRGTWNGFDTFLDDEHRAQIQSARDLRVIESSIRMIIRTQRGERVMLPRFGTQISGFVFDPHDDTIRSEIRRDIGEALRLFEPRIIVDDVLVQESRRDPEHQIDVRVVYRLVEGLQNVQEFDLSLPINTTVPTN